MFSVFEPNSIIQGPSSNDGASHPPKPPTKPSRRREKPQLSCTICRQKKLKCDRVKPSCSVCVKRGHPESCDYIKHDPSRMRATGLQGPRNVQARVRELEQMVRTLLENQSNHDQGVPSAERSPSAPSPKGPAQDDAFTHSSAPSPQNQMDPNIPEASLGKFTKTKDQVNFVGSEHWESILEDITQLKIDMETPDASEVADFKPQILFGITPASRSEIMASIPPRPICDMLISRWFRTMDLAPMILHAPTFMKEYDRMFQLPDETPLTWVGLLFSILGIASYFFAVAGEDLPTMPEPFTSMWEMTGHFRDRSAQTLIEVNYLRPKRYTVETLCFYYALDKFQARESEFGAYVLTGIIVRVAMRLGYHCDASHYPSISPFQGEMRRRVWSMIYQLDLTTSAQVGLPRMIRDTETDTAEPKNLLDTDFDEDVTELPHPRPSTDVTPVAYAIFKVRLLRQLGQIVDQTNSIMPPSYDEVMRLDSNLMEAHATLPPYLIMRSLSLAIADNADVILRRYALEACFQKSRCVLHRKYLIPGKSNPQYRYSRTASVDAAVKLLDIQSSFFSATEPGGQLFGEQWRMSALLNQDYLLAAMVLCLDLTWGLKVGKEPSSDCEDEIETMWPRNERLKNLQNSYEIWSQSSKTSALAAKATGALKFMLKDLEPSQSAEADPTFSVSDLSSLSDDTPAPQLSAHTDQAYFGDPNKFDINAPPFVGSSAADFLTGTIDSEMNFDWGLWDSQFLPTALAEQDFNSPTFQF